MRNTLRKLLKNEFFLLTLFLLKLWLTLKHLNHRYNYNSKHRYIIPNDSEFMKKYTNYYDSSVAAFENMQKWIATNGKPKPLFNRDNVTLCVGVLSQKRVMSLNINYPFQTVVSLLVRTKLKHQEDVRIDVLNVDDVARSDLKDLNGLVNIVDLREKPSRFNRDLSPKVKESTDYVNAMDFYSNSQPQCKYVLLLEDDSLASPDWYEKIMQAIGRIRAPENWFCLKLFTSYRPYDWLIHIPTVLISILMALLLSFLFIRLFYFVLYLKYRFILGIPRPQIHKSKLIILIFVVNSLLIVGLYNWRHVSPLGTGVHSFAIGFNTVANVFPKSKLVMVSSYIENSVESYVSGRVSDFEPKDIALNGFRFRTRLKEYVVEPAVFQHVGLQSSLGPLINSDGIFKVQYRPFQSYSFEKEFSQEKIRFDPAYWTSE